MRIRNCALAGRKAWELDIGSLSIVMTAGGGHIASLTLRGTPKVNPLWAPIWKSIEPWQYNGRRHKDKYGIKLLAGILGHNLCLGWFGEPSEEEKACGMETHGEASLVRWRPVVRKVSQKAMSLTCRCTLSVSQMELTRTLKTRKNSNIVDVTEVLRNLSRRDLPYTVCQHVTFGPPFLKKGVTLFDMPAKKCHTFPDKFSTKQRLKINTAFEWPCGPGSDGKRVDMRMIGREYKSSSDYTANLIEPRRDLGWFAAVNPELGMLVAYAWKRSDFPWVGNWEENYCRRNSPWNGKSLTRGMEFANTPFPIPLRNAVTMGKFQGQPSYGWLPAGGRIRFDYSIICASVPNDVKGVAGIEATKTGFVLDLVR